MAFIRNILIVLAVTIVCVQITGQDKVGNDYNQSVDIFPTLALTTDFNMDDVYIGFSGGIEDIGYQWGARLGFQFRPYRKKIQIKEDNIIRQYLERKYLLHLDIDKRFGHIRIQKQHFQFYAGGRFGLLMGNYSGTRNDADNHFVVAPFGGVCWNIEDNVFIKLGYNYFNDRLLNVDDGRVNISFQFLIN